MLLRTNRPSKCIGLPASIGKEAEQMTHRDPALIRGEQDHSIEDNPYWRFSIAFYARPGISDLLLKAQEDHTLDVNMLLFALWRAGDGRTVSPGDFSELIDVVADWRNIIVLPTRALRYSLKRRDSGGELYAKAKSLELLCERMQQQLMYEYALRHYKSEPFDGTVERLAFGNLASYVEAMGLSLPNPIAEQLTRELLKFVEL